MVVSATTTKELMEAVLCLEYYMQRKWIQVRRKAAQRAAAAPLRHPCSYLVRRGHARVLPGQGDPLRQSHHRAACQDPAANVTQWTRAMAWRT